MVNEFSSSMIEEFYSCGPNLILCGTYTSVYPQNIFNIIYFVGLAYHITCTFASEFFINFLCIDA